MTNWIQTCFRFGEWAVEFMFIPPLVYVLLGAALSFVASEIKQRPLRSGKWKRNHWYVLTHLAFFAAAIIVGVAWQNSVTNPTVPHPANRIGGAAIEVVLYASIVSCVFWVWRMKGFRWFASSLMVLMELPIFGALFVAGMSVSGDWL